MNKIVEPAGIAPPAANYAHAIKTTGAFEWLHTSGVVPVAVDGTVPDGLADQAAMVWHNLHAILAAAGMGPEHVISVTTFVVVGADLGVVMSARDRYLDGRRAASTLVTVPALARPEWQMEVALVAARSDEEPGHGHLAW